VTAADRAWFAEQFAALGVQLEALRADLGRLGSGRGARDQADRDLVPAIARAIGDRGFTSRELVDHAREDRALAAAILSTDTTNARELGKLLARVEGCAVDGFTVAKVDTGRDGLVWQVQVSQV
jgi:uncharacterized membrane protein